MGAFPSRDPIRERPLTKHGLPVGPNCPTAAVMDATFAAYSAPESDAFFVSDRCAFNLTQAPLAVYLYSKFVNYERYRHATFT